jgi:hypothetical protein
MRTITLSGTPRERGRIHGETLRGAIHEHMAHWSAVCRQKTGLSPLAYLDKFYNDTDFLPAARRLTPDLVAEVEGIAEGAALPFELVFIRQLSDEEPWYRKCLQLGIAVREHCSALGVRSRDGRPNLIGQNMDTPRYYEGFQLLARIREPDGETEALVFTLTGKLSLCGMNNHGLAICCNSLPQMSFNRCGLPEDFIVRRVLQLRTVREAMIFMQSIPHASGQNYILGGPDGVLDLECSANRVEVWNPDPAGGRVWHTNHPLVNTDCALWDSAMAMMAATDPASHEAFVASMTTFRRLDVLERKVRAAAILDGQAIKDILDDRDAPLCQDSEDSFTLCSTLMECSAERPLMHIASAPLGGALYKSYGFGTDGAGSDDGPDGMGGKDGAA